MILLVSGLQINSSTLVNCCFQMKNPELYARATDKAEKRQWFVTFQDGLLVPPGSGHNVSKCLLMKVGPTKYTLYLLPTVFNGA